MHSKHSPRLAHAGMGWRRQRVLVRCRFVVVQSSKLSETESVSQTSQHLPTIGMIQSRDRLHDRMIDGACGPHGPETSLPIYK